METPTNPQKIEIRHCDALTLLKSLSNNSINCIITDPPYNTGMTSKGQEEHRMGSSAKKPRLFGFFDDKLSPEAYQNLISGVCSEFYRVLKDNSPCYIWINWKSLGLWLKSLEEVGFTNKNCIVWDKGIHGLNYQNYAHTHEFCIFAVKGDFFPDNKKGLKFYKDVWNIKRNLNNETDENHHETKKSEKVINLNILHGSKENDLILDCFLGSGTTAICCAKLNRRFIGCDIMETYVNMAKQDVIKAQSQKQVLDYFQNGNNGQKETDDKESDGKQEVQNI